jgi:hypothetical protein
MVTLAESQYGQTMGCCVLVIALISQLFALRRKIRLALGLPVREWYDDGPQASVGEVWRGRFRTALQSTAARSLFAALVVGELTFAIVAVPDSKSLIAAHRDHLRQAIEFITSYAELPDRNSWFCAPKSPDPNLADTHAP